MSEGIGDPLMLSASLLLSVVYGMLASQADDVDELDASLDVRPITDPEVQDDRRSAILRLGGAIA